MWEPQHFCFLCEAYYSTFLTGWILHGELHRQLAVDAPKRDDIVQTRRPFVRLLSMPYVVLIWHQWSDVAFYNINKHYSERCIMQMYWDTSSVIYIEVIGCFGSVNIIHPCPDDTAETMFCVPAAFAYDSALLIQSHFLCGFSCASNSSYTNILWWVAGYLKD